MSATMTWASSGAGTKTGVTNQSLLDDLVTLIGSYSGNAAFNWEVAGSNTGSTPRYVLLRRKDASNGRIAIIIWDTAPAANNIAILDTTPLANGVQTAYFPNGTGTTLSNLTAASGTICGNDSGVIKCANPGTVASLYAALFQVYYFDHAEGMVFCFQNPAAATTYALGAGAHLVDGSDVAYDCVFATSGSQRWDLFSSTSQAPMPWNTLAQLAGFQSSQGYFRTNYGATNRVYYSAYVPSANWAAQLPSGTDILSDTSLNSAWFIAPQLLGVTKGEGTVLKWRQVGWGPGTVGPLQVYNTTGPVAAARQATISTAGSLSAPWMVNVKL